MYSFLLPLLIHNSITICLLVAHFSQPISVPTISCGFSEPDLPSLFTVSKKLRTFQQYCGYPFQVFSFSAKFVAQTLICSYLTVQFPEPVSLTVAVGLLAIEIVRLF
jgi:hypothetical protein